jgi:hypothetical protein
LGADRTELNAVTVLGQKGDSLRSHVTPRFDGNIGNQILFAVWLLAC